MKNHKHTEAKKTRNKNCDVCEWKKCATKFFNDEFMGLKCITIAFYSAQHSTTDKPTTIKPDTMRRMIGMLVEKLGVEGVCEWAEVESNNNNNKKSFN